MSGSSSSSSSISISENLENILNFDFENINKVLSEPQSDSLSDNIKDVADGFKKYNDVRQVLICYMNYKF